MQVLIVLAHPEPTSFCVALKNEAVGVIVEAGHDVVVSDLYADNFNPVAGRHDFVGAADLSRFHYQTEQLHAATVAGFSNELAREQARVRSADVILLLFPLWWGGPPAILKGWIDRVLAYGFAYADGRRFDTGLFKSKRGLICVTTGGTPARFTPDGVYGEIEKVLWPVQHLTLDYMGLASEEPFVCYGTPRVPAEVRAGYLQAWRKRLTALLDKDRISGPEEPASMPDDPMAWTRNI